MNILIVGCNRLGALLSNYLDAHGHDVAVVDSDEDSFQLLSETYSGMKVAGMPLDMTVLRQAGIEHCDAMAVVTSDDNLNITVSQIAQEFFHVQNVVSRITDPYREEMFKRFGLKAICPTNLARDSVLTALTGPWDAQSLTFGTSTVGFHIRAVDAGHVGIRVSDAPKDEDEVLFGVLHRDGSMALAAQNTDLAAAEGDKIIFAKIQD